MSVEESVEKVLEDVYAPGIGRSIVQMGMVRKIEATGEGVKVTLASTALDPNSREQVESMVHTAIKGANPDDKIEVEFVEQKPQELNQISKVVAVMSGKGGVGKSLVSGLIAVALNREGCKVGILDADITGPSIPKMFGIKDRPGGGETGILPVFSSSGIEIMSINLLLPQEDDAVIWRGPLISKAIQQFWEDVVWGKLDYLIVDLPPGTADASLTVMQTLPLFGVIIVFTPQDLTAMIVRKAVHMAEKMNTPILGVVENMSYFLLPDSGKKIEIFGKSKGEEMARAAKTPLLGQVPLDSELARLCDEGKIETYNSEVFLDFSHTITHILPSPS